MVSKPIMKSSMIVPQKIKNKISILSSNPNSGLHIKKSNIEYQRDICTTMLNVAFIHSSQNVHQMMNGYITS